MNYKKSILSLVTIMALSGTASADSTATYLPLTTDLHDASWTLFGVNGFSTGVSSARGSSSSGFSPDLLSVKEDTGETQDHDATCGLGVSPNHRLCVQVIDDVNINQLEVATSGEHIFEATEPVRTMYIKLNSNTPNVKIDYKSSFEGQTLEMLVNNGSTLYAVTLDEDKTYSNAAIAVEASVVASTDPKLSKIEDVIDYNFKNNPLEAAYFDASKHLETKADMKLNYTTAPAESATFYHFDSVSQQWKIWDSKFEGSANDFTEFSKGDAYWGLIDTDDATPNNDSSELNVTASGLILGGVGNSAPTTDVYKYDDGVTSKLTNGWNMISFDESEPYIRHAATGMTATFDTAAVNGTISITDSSGMHKLPIDINETTTELIASKINVTIDKAKLAGTIPPFFNVRAFRTSATEVTFISDAKFSLTDGDDQNNISTVKTLTNSEPYNATATRVAITDLNESATGTSAIDAQATSAYGEYALIVDLLTSDLANDGDTANMVKVAADLDSNAALGDTALSAMIRIGTTSQDPAAIGLAPADNTDTQPTAATAATEISSHPVFNNTTGKGKLTEIDSNGNGFSDKVILASTVPFYIKDNTFVRAFEDDNSTNNGSRAFNVVGTATESVVPAVNGTHLDTASLIMAKAGTTGVYADANDTSNPNHIVAVSTTLSTFDIKDLEDGDNEFFKNTISSSKMAQGAVAGVYPLDEVAKLDLVINSATFDNIAIPDSLNTLDYESNITIFINGRNDVNVTLTDIQADSTSESNITGYFDTIVNSINTLLQEQNLTAFAYHTYVDGTSSAVTNAIDVVIRGFDINTSTTMTYDTNNSAQTVAATYNDDVNGTTTANGVFIPGARTLGASWPALVSDLKSNAIYAPNFASYGPLYTLNDAGYKVRSILKATTEFTNGSIAWDGIDLTRDEADWFANNEFNLFSANLHAGYWAYLEPKGSDSIVIGTANFIPTYTYYFDNKDASGEYKTTNIVNGGQFTVEITGFDGEISSAYVKVKGTEVQLKRNGTSDEYTADFTKYSIANFNEGDSGDISFSVRATDGKGEDQSASDVYAFDYTAPVLLTPTAPDTKTVKFSADANTSDVAKFHVFKEYIPELAASRSSATATTNRLVGTYTATAGEASTNVCEGLSFGDVNNLRVVGVDGSGDIGSANVSDAIQFVYATMLNSSEVLTHIAGSSDDKAIIGLRYDNTCSALATQPTLASENKGVSLKSLKGTETARLAYEMIDGLGSSLSGAFLSTYSINSEKVIQVQNLEEYAGKPFFVEYGGKMYRSAFPSTLAEATASSVTPIKLDDTATAFELDATTGLRTATSGTGEELSSSLLNNTLAP